MVTGERTHVIRCSNLFVDSVTGVSPSSSQVPELDAKLPLDTQTLLYSAPWFFALGAVN